MRAKNIVISWKGGGAQSARAVSSALPRVKSTQTGTAINVDSDHSPARRGSNLKSYLVWHGVRAKAQSLSDFPSTVGAKLMEYTEMTDPDLLATGANTYNRMRQLILGGVATYVLEHSSIYVLMAH